MQGQATFPLISIHAGQRSQGCVSLFERYAKGGDDPKLRDWAGKTLPTFQHHLEMAQDLGKK
jgi:putative membrane protein